MKVYRLMWIFMLSCGLSPHVSASEPDGRRTRYFHHVQRMDSVSGEWHWSNATARISEKSGELEVVIWNDWADPRINPLAKIILSLPPEQDTLRNVWRYRGRIFRFSRAGKNCCVESCTKLAITRNTDFTIRETGRTTRYRISRQKH